MSRVLFLTNKESNSTPNSPAVPAKYPLRRLTEAVYHTDMSPCPECALLRRRLADTVLMDAGLRVQLKQAVQDRKGEVVTALILSEAAALRERDAVEAALRRHEATAHGLGDAQGQTG